MDPRKIYRGSSYRAERKLLVGMARDARAKRIRCSPAEFEGIRRTMAGLRRAFWQRGNAPYRNA